MRVCHLHPSEHEQASCWRRDGDGNICLPWLSQAPVEDARYLGHGGDDATRYAFIVGSAPQPASGAGLCGTTCTKRSHLQDRSRIKRPLGGSSSKLCGNTAEWRHRYYFFTAECILRSRHQAYFELDLKLEGMLSNVPEIPNESVAGWPGSGKVRFRPQPHHRPHQRHQPRPYPHQPAPRPHPRTKRQERRGGQEHSGPPEVLLPRKGKGRNDRFFLVLNEKLLLVR